MPTPGRIIVVTGFPPWKISELSEAGAFLQPILQLASRINDKQVSLPIPTLGAVTVASYARSKGLDAEVVDFYLDRVDLSGADVVGISSSFMRVKEVADIVAAARTQSPKATIVLGGPLSWSFSPAQIWEAVPDVDVIVQGEGEETFVELVSCLRSKGSLEGVRGIFFRKSGRIVETAARSPLNLDELPLPNWGLMMAEGGRRIPLLPVETSRGCLYDCAMCSEVHYWPKPARYASPEHVVNQMRQNVQDYGIRTFRLSDSCFTAPPARSMEVCDAIYEGCVKDGLEVQWSCYARINNLSPELLEKMARAGCIAMDVGVESGDLGVLKMMNRHYSPETIIRAAKDAREAGILVHFNFVVGFPGETEESIDNTIRVIEEARPDSYGCFLFFVAPHTHACDRAEQYGLVGSGLDWRHQTMDSWQAGAGIERIFKEITSVPHFVGGEYMMGYLGALGYSPQQVRKFFWATNELCRNEASQEAQRLVEDAAARLRPYS